MVLYITYRGEKMYTFDDYEKDMNIADLEFQAGQLYMEYEEYAKAQNHFYKAANLYKTASQTTDQIEVFFLVKAEDSAESSLNMAKFCVKEEEKKIKQLMSNDKEFGL
jgi:hypothetical protein